jgi:glycosyltransferase involved in cell wall biosynthesis/O-antigen/teichoic acid export membrane protein
VLDLAPRGMAAADARFHILVLTDRDWTHPQGGGTGTNLFGQVSRWLAWGHRVTVIACGYPGAVACERVGDMTVHRIGGRVTVFPRASWRQWRGLVPDADVVLEVFNGISFMTPLWLRTPRVTLVHHVHRDHYVAEMGRKGRLAAYLLETVPLRTAYRRSRFLTVSHSTAEQLVQTGIPSEQICVNYNGVEAAAFGPGDKAPTPTLLYLGRLKRYKRLELVLDAVEAIPGAVLEIAGDGDHRAQLEAEIAERGLGDRVRMYGHVDEPTKLRLLQRAWVHVIASGNEGWSLTVMEAAACGTPTVAMAAGGLRESVVHDHTGLLADDGDALVAATRRLIDDAELRHTFGANALARARELSWDRCASATIDELEAARAQVVTRREPAPAPRPEPARATRSLAATVAAANLMALLPAMLLARLLGAADFGAFTALLSVFLIVSMPGAALQLGVAREVRAGLAARAGDPTAWLAAWSRRLAVVTAFAAVGSVLLRDTLVQLTGVHAPWAAAAIVPAGSLWLLLSVQRGALQGLGRSRAVKASLAGEAAARAAVGLALVGAGLGLAGAMLGILVALVAASLVGGAQLASALPRGAAQSAAPRLDAVFGRMLLPLVVLTIAAFAQNLDVVVAQHLAFGATGTYAAAAVAAKCVVWLAVGLSITVLPKALRQAREGAGGRTPLIDAIPALAVMAILMMLLYAVTGGPLLALIYGQELGGAVDVLPWLAGATGLLALAYLTVQRLLARGESRFVWPLAALAIGEPLALGLAAPQSADVAYALLGVQLAVVAAVAAMLLRPVASPRPTVADTAA